MPFSTWFLPSHMLVGLIPAMCAPATSAVATETEGVPVMFHFKDPAGETIDFASITAPYDLQEGHIVATVDEGGALGLDEALSFAVYEHYATFGDRQRDITDECSLDAAAGTVSIPGVLCGHSGNPRHRLRAVARTSRL
ncbi:MAG: hypothetical protein ACLTDR_13675 [Adlercreutzia equolifaciens]